MSESPDAEKPEAEQIAGWRAAQILGVALIAGFLGVVALTARDAARRAELEQVWTRTAVEDQRYFSLPDAAARQPFSLVAKLGETPLFLVSEQVLHLKEAELRSVGNDAENRYGVYRLSGKIPKTKGEPALDAASVYFLKIDVGSYVKVTTQAAAGK